MKRSNREQLRVTHVAHTAERGGAELALLKVLNDPARDWSASVVLPRGERGVFSNLREDTTVAESGAKQPPGASGAGLNAALSFAWKLVKQAARLRVNREFRRSDVVHANSTRAAVYSAIACFTSRKPLVVHLRDRIEPEAIGKFGFVAFKRIVLPRATAFIANSDATAETVRRYVRSGQIVEVIPSPVGVARAREVPLAPPGRVRVGMVARLDPWKGQAELLEAFARANVEEQAELVFIGDAAFGHQDYEKKLRQLAADLGVERVTFAGFRSDVQAAVDALDVCVQYSTRPEPLGQNVLQYLARARATIVAAEGGPLEWVVHRRNGLVVPPRDVASLATALRELVLDADQRNELSRGAIEDERLPTDSEICAAHGDVFKRAAAIGEQ
ncbi:glycosyltransferase family 4 protein [Microbacterium sp. JZ37]|uniref:glycosyltransferase family 4 protein n=1 Tax=Microbacterium sp. JZ37 TaxID=2654193 RepID=UPI002B481EE1|nr:glycosyltransferase family 4 protein [Microbacterium sp. JZ37]WRH18256.1 glycosyltransferase [Microbacterium sp. JZ37]